MVKENRRLPNWLRKPLAHGNNLCQTYKQMEKAHLHTVCQEANCPNRAECFSKKTATFLALGNICSRNCRFCNISTGKVFLPPDPKEPENILKSAIALELKHIVITMVTRDDLPDGGAAHIAKIVKTVKSGIKDATCEVLASDFSGDFDHLETVLKEKPDVFNHNVETVKSLSPQIRDQRASYEHSLEILHHADRKVKNRPIVKSGLMVGLGETKEEVFQTIKDLASVGCEVITIGQYLQPTKDHHPVSRYAEPIEYTEYERFGRSVGVKLMICGPFVRSSYKTKDFLEKAFI